MVVVVPCETGNNHLIHSCSSVSVVSLSTGPHVAGVLHHPASNENPNLSETRLILSVLSIRFMDNFESNIGDVIAQLRQMLPDGSAHLERISTSIDQPAAALLRRLDSVGAAAEGADASERVELEAELETAMQSLVQIVLDETSEPDSAAAALGELRYLTRDKWCSKVATGQGLIEACVGLLSRLSQRADPESKLCTEQAAAVLQNLSGPADDKLGSGYDHFDSTWHEPRAKLVSTLPGLLPLMEQSLLHGSEVC